MIFVCTKKFDNFLKDCNEKFLYDFESNVFLNSKNNLIPCSNYCDDLRLNVLHSAYTFFDSMPLDTKFEFIFDPQTSLFGSLNSVDSLIKRKILNNKISNFIYINDFILSLDEIKQIVMISKFFIKTKIVTKTENLFDICFNYHIYLKQKKQTIK